MMKWFGFSMLALLALATPAAADCDHAAPSYTGGTVEGAMNANLIDACNNAKAANNGGATAAGQATGNTSLNSIDTKMGEVQASPTANTQLDRLKALKTSIDAVKTSVDALITQTQATQPVGGATASGASVTENPLADGCRAATTAPTAVTDGQKVNRLCGAEGKGVVLPFTIKELAVRGIASATDNAAHTIIASAGGSLKNYITNVECFNTSATTTTVTFNDSVSSVMGVSAGGGNNWTLQVPLATAAATAFNFTPAAGVTTLTCNAQGYTGP